MDQVLNAFKASWKYISFPLFEISGTKISVISVLLCIAFFALSIRLANMAEKFIERMLKDKDLDIGVKGSISRFTRYAVIIVGALIALDTVGISLSSLAALGAVLMVGIGFGLQNITQNFISGLIILLERPIKVGDKVKVQGVSGKVVEIGARSTLIHTRDDIAIIVPNSQFISEQVVNESFSGEQIRLHLEVGVSYSSDPEVVKGILLEIASEHSMVLSDPAPRVFFKNFGDSSLDFALTIWVRELWHYERIMSDLRFAVMRKFKENHIEIPFPQRDLHLRSSDVKLS
ncbi:MAG: mechanosensitive ion channel [Deltaproteobacteria bacterium]|nr:MAG: mechanosensitive ion channel [Deltaproteobacteria bacterium]TNF30768.1 MAG: mechanosensitive ion channel [Deltaproteobacteria bacterium]